MKFKGGSDLGGMQIHNRREKDHSNTNPDYDPSKSHLNYALVQSPAEKSFNQLVDERIAIGYKGKIVKGEIKPTAIRKDAVKMVEVLFASDKAFFDTLTASEQRKYFEDCLSWAKKRFGADNIFSAVVHVADEHKDGSPHMHLDFVPLTADGELSANKILGGRVALQKMQDDFWETVGKPWGLERGERADLADENAERPRKNLSDKQYKAQKAQETLVRTLTETQEALARVKHLEDAKHALERAVEGIQSELKAYTEIQVQLDNVDSIGEKILFSKNMSVSPDTLETLKQSYKSFLAMQPDVKRLHKLDEREKKQEERFRQREDFIERKEKRAADYHKQAETIFDEVTLGKATLEEYEKQKHLLQEQKQLIIQLKKDLQAEKEKNTAHSNDNAVLKANIADRERKLKNTMSVLTNVVSAVKMLYFEERTGKPNEYKLKEVSLLQKSLMVGLVRYGSLWAIRHGYEGQSREMLKMAGFIHEKIQKLVNEYQLSEIEARRQRELEALQVKQQEQPMKSSTESSKEIIKKSEPEKEEKKVQHPHQEPQQDYTYGRRFK